MNHDWIRQHCLSFPHTTEHIQWGNDVVFKVGGKMFAVMALEPAPHLLSFKSSEEQFRELVERSGVVPAPYLARAHWVALERWDAISRTELKERLSAAYDLVFAKLPRKVQAELGAGRQT